MLHKNKTPQDTERLSENYSKQTYQREIPQEKDGAKNPWKALTNLKQEYNNMLEGNNLRQKQSNTQQMKYVL